MKHPHRIAAYSSALALSLVLAACGGGGSSSSPSAVATTPPQPLPPAQLVLGPNSTAPLYEPGQTISPPAATSDTATDALNQFNYRRLQAGLAAVSRNGNIDVAARGHSNYQKVNDTITHVQTFGMPAFTGQQVLDRLTAAQYAFGANGYAYGEVIAASGDLSGVNNAEDLITAIYHRFVVMEPKFREAGSGSAGPSATKYNFVTVDFAANGLSGGLGAGQVSQYPFPGQTNIPSIFYNYQESPDPVPSQRGVGYPVSVHADIDTTLSVNSFTIQPRGGQTLQTRLLSNAGNAQNAPDPETPKSAAAIVPIAVLTAGTTYDVSFSGTVSGKPVSRIWSFTTAP